MGSTLLDKGSAPAVAWVDPRAWLRGSDGEPNGEYHLSVSLASLDVSVCCEGNYIVKSGWEGMRH